MEQPDKSDRRKFLKLASVGTLVGGAAIVVGAPVKAETQSAETGIGYQETPHIKTYYDLAKF